MQLGATCAGGNSLGYTFFWWSRKPRSSAESEVGRGDAEIQEQRRKSSQKVEEGID